MNALGTRVIIINDLQSAIDLLETRSAIYSNRPVFPFAGEMYAQNGVVYPASSKGPLSCSIGWNRQMILSQYNERFRLMRKYVKAYIGTKSAIAPYKTVQEAETRYFLARILDNPNSVLENVRRLEPANIP